MAIIKIQCPHCSTRNISVSIIACKHKVGQPNEGSLYTTCSACDCESLIEISDTYYIHGLKSLVDKGSLYDLTEQVEVSCIYPAQKDIPEHLPEDIEDSYKEAQDSLSNGNLKAAALMYRTTIEQALKELGAFRDNLNRSIEEFQHGDVYENLKKAAHQVRLLGNGAAHDKGAATKEAVEEIAAFTDFFLNLMYSVPGKLKQLNTNQVDAA